MLNLNEVLEEEKIKFGDDEFKVLCEIPVKVMLKYSNISNTENKSIEKQINEIKSYLTEILSLNNDNKKVVDFLEKLSFQKLIKVSTFISEFQNEYATKNDNKKK